MEFLKPRARGEKKMSYYGAKARGKKMDYSSMEAKDRSKDDMQEFDTRVRPRKAGSIVREGRYQKMGILRPRDRGEKDLSYSEAKDRPFDTRVSGRSKGILAPRTYQEVQTMGFFEPKQRKEHMNMLIDKPTPRAWQPEKTMSNSVVQKGNENAMRYPYGKTKAQRFLTGVKSAARAVGRGAKKVGGYAAKEIGEEVGHRYGEWKKYKRAKAKAIGQERVRELRYRTRQKYKSKRQGIN